jgi:hypothetical protein
MPEDYAKDIRAVVRQGLLDPKNDVEDCQLLFARACGTMLGFVMVTRFVVDCWFLFYLLLMNYLNPSDYPFAPCDAFCPPQARTLWSHVHRFH